VLAQLLTSDQPSRPVLLGATRVHSSWSLCAVHVWRNGGRRLLKRLGAPTPVVSERVVRGRSTGHKEGSGTSLRCSSVEDVAEELWGGGVRRRWWLSDSEVREVGTAEVGAIGRARSRGQKLTVDAGRPWGGGQRRRHSSWWWQWGSDEPQWQAVGPTAQGGREAWVRPATRGLKRWNDRAHLGGGGSSKSDGENGGLEAGSDGRSTGWGAVFRVLDLKRVVRMGERGATTVLDPF
jgi:hypothetical protein